MQNDHDRILLYHVLGFLRSNCRELLKSGSEANDPGIADITNEEIAFLTKKWTCRKHNSRMSEDTKTRAMELVGLWQCT